MSGIVATLIEMGFSKERSELAVSETGASNIEAAMDWILSHEEEPEPSAALPSTVDTNKDVSENENISTSSQSLEAKSLRCDDCGKLFKNQTEVEFHAAKSGHENYSESGEEKKPLTEEEKQQQLAKIEAKLKQRRLDREAKEKQEALDREKNRIKSGKDMLEAKRKQEDIEILKMLELRKREKQEEKMARERVKEQIEQDKLARKAKFGGAPTPEKTEARPVVTPLKVSSSSSSHYSEVKLQIRLTNGSSLTHTFGAKEPLSAVRVFVEINRTDEPGPFSLMTSFPKNVFSVEDYEKPLDLLGLAPSAVLIVSKT